MSRYADIIERLEKAEGADRDIDRHLLDILGVEVKEFDPGDGDVSQWRVWADGSRVANTHVTSSLDASIELVERMIATEGRKLICFFCAGGQLTAYNADDQSPDYHPLAKIDNSVTVGWLAHVAFYGADGKSVGPEEYSHGRTAPLAILLALFRTLSAQEAGS